MKLILTIFITFIVTGGSADALDTKPMIGMSYDDCVKTYHLDKYEFWSIPNLPKNQENVYWLPDGDLSLTFDGDKIIHAEFRPSTLTIEERKKEVYKAWDEYVKAHPIPAQKSPDSNPDKK